MDRQSDRYAFTIFFVYSILAGGNSVGVKFSNLELEPFWGATLRFSLAAALMLVIMAVGRHAIPRGRALMGAALYGLLAFGGAFAFLFYGLVELEAGFSQIVLSIVPLLTILLAVTQRLERLRFRAFAGAILALAGVIVMSSLAFEDSIPIGSVLAAGAGAFCFAQASLVIKRFPQGDPISTNAIGMTAGAVFLAVVAIVAGDDMVLPKQADTWIALIYMVVFGSVVVFTLYVVLLGLWDASRVNYGFVIIPVVSVLLSAWLLDERLTWGLIGGGALVLVGVYIGALRTANQQS